MCTGEVRLYNEKVLIASLQVGEPITALRFGCYGREEAALIAVGTSGSLTIKMLQRQEFMRRFYGKSHEEQLAELNELIRFSMNIPDAPPVYRDQKTRRKDVRIDLSLAPTDEELLEALDEVEAGDESVLVTSEGEMSLPQDKPEGEQESETEQGEKEVPDEDAGKPAPAAEAEESEEN